MKEKLQEADGAMLMLGIFHWESSSFEGNLSGKKNDLASFSDLSTEQSASRNLYLMYRGSVLLM